MIWGKTAKLLGKTAKTNILNDPPKTTQYDRKMSGHLCVHVLDTYIVVSKMIVDERPAWSVHRGGRRMYVGHDATVC